MTKLQMRVSLLRLQDTEPAAEQSIMEPEQDIEPEQDVEEEKEEWENEDDDDDDSLPSFEFRVETAKLLIELDEHNNAATQVHLLPLTQLQCHLSCGKLSHHAMEIA